jgi:UDPglucose 6-dehydrogenase
MRRIRDLLRAPIVIDLRNIYAPDEVRKHGLKYFSIGRS